MKKIVLDDIAKELGVSKSLVSFVMNGRAKEMRVSDSMAEKILLKAKEMGYQPNHLARALRTGRSYTLGLIVADIANPFFAKLARSIENEAIRHNYNVIFGSSDENALKSKQLVKVFLDKKVDGLIICPSNEERELIKSLKIRKIPFVLIDRYFEDLESNVVAVNNKKGSFEILENQILKGSQRIGYVGFEFDQINAKLRLDGYLEAHVKYKLNADPSLIKKVPFIGIEEKTEAAVDELLQLGDPVDSIFFGNNQLVSIGLKKIKKYNRTSKKPVHVCSFDGYDLMELLGIQMVFGVQPIDELGRLGVELILDQIGSQKPLNRKEIIPIKISELEGESDELKK